MEELIALSTLEGYGLDLHIILKNLSVFGPFVYAANNSSVYVHFTEIKHKLRISNHEERKKYGYKWQLRVDGVPKKQKPYVNYHSDVSTLCRHMHNYYSKVSKC